MVTRSTHFTATLIAGELCWGGHGGGGWPTGEEQNGGCWALGEEETEHLGMGLAHARGGGGGWKKKETKRFLYNGWQLRVINL
jgi:hypothetical protein